MKVSIVSFTIMSLVLITCISGSPVSQETQIALLDSISSRESEPDVSSFLERNMDVLSGKTLKVVFRISPPGTEEMAGGVLELQNGTKIYLDGSGVPLIWDLRDSLNLTLDMRVAVDWDPAWDMVAKGDVDLGVPLRTVQLYLTRIGALRTVMLLHPVLSMTSNVYFRQPPVGSISNIIFGPLKTETWIILTSCWAICVVACCTIHHCSNSNEKFSFSDLILWIVAIINGRDYPIDNQEDGRMSLRIALLSTMCLSVVALALYTAKIVSFFSVKSDDVKTPDDLLKHGYSLSSISHIHVDRVFKNLKNKHHLIKTSMENFISGEDTMRKLVAPRNKLESRLAFLTHPDGFYIYGRFNNNFSKELCEISTFSSTIKTSRSMYIKKDSPFREVLNWKILQLVERGINHRHQTSQRMKYEYSCFSESKQSVEELSLQQTLCTFLILIAGAVIAVFIECLGLFARIYRYIRRPYQVLEERESNYHKYSNSSIGQ